MNDTPSIHALIHHVAETVPGWTPTDQLMALFTIACTTEHLHGDILELGSWCGRSAVILGAAAKLTGKGIVHCIDLFPEAGDWYQNADGSHSFTVRLGGKTIGAYQQQTVWDEPFQRDIVPVYQKHRGTLEAFMSAIASHGLTERVIPHRSDLETFLDSRAPDLALRMAFIDGDHSYQAVCSDIGLLEPLLLPGGWLCFDDAFTSYDGVNRAIEDRIIQSGNYRLHYQATRKMFVAQRNH